MRCTAVRSYSTYGAISVARLFEKSSPEPAAAAPNARKNRGVVHVKRGIFKNIVGKN